MRTSLPGVNAAPAVPNKCQRQVSEGARASTFQRGRDATCVRQAFTHPQRSNPDDPT